ncbi:hypothetical protein [Cellvibrio sp. OA-2007]|uniref:hypothetical protein n=1 Tax=Cellvibrio sp. OA-2007 TaxID=529823 RepID=UPI0007808C76|nr:hypothetical protein [Cellvibrio sp. OA-2007]
MSGNQEKLREKSVVISFRLPVSVYEPFREPVNQTCGGNRSKFFRALFVDKKVKFVANGNQSAGEDYKKYLHLVNKASNNLNQLAKLLNGAEKSGKITSAQYLAGLNNLNSIRLLLNSKLGKED